MMTTIRRQAASCIYGLKPFLEEMLKRHLDKLFWDAGRDGEEEADESFVSIIETQITELIALANTLDDEDPKYNALLKIIKEKQTFPNNRIMLFGTFRHTLYYLKYYIKKYAAKKFPEYFFDEKALSLEKYIPDDAIQKRSSEYSLIASAAGYYNFDSMVRAFIKKNGKSNIVYLGVGSF
jgi:hypothetical protein